MNERLKQYHLRFGFLLLFLCNFGLYKGTVSRTTGGVLFVIGSAITITSVYIILAKYRNNGRILRKPCLPFLSYLLSYHVVHSFVFDFACIVLAGGLIARTFPNLSMYYWVFICIVLAPVSRYVVANSIIRHLKWCLGAEFKVIVFRRFSSEYSGANRVLVAPVFGAYGQVIAIYDQALTDSAAAGLHADSESILGEPFMAIRCEDHNWKDTVKRELANADLAVFHWPDLPTENMKWEFQQAVRSLPGDRLIWICIEPTADKIEEWLRRAGVSSHTVTVIRIKDRIDYVFGNYRYLAKAAYGKLKSLRVRERTIGEYQ
jgi:hypothetical protein